jgi:signal transduction histidine kinase
MCFFPIFYAMMEGSLKPRSKVRKSVWGLIVVVIATAALLVLINYLTIKTLSATRAYTNGESRYSKAQKDAARHLISFIESGDNIYWTEFKKELTVPIGDSIARVALASGLPKKIVVDGFIQGMNHPDDVDNLIWLFKNFQSISFMKEAIQIWKEADKLVGEMHTLGQSVYADVKSGALTEVDKLEILTTINELTARLTLKEHAFSNVIGDAARKISFYLFIVNLVLIVVIIGTASYYAFVMIRRLRENNKDLVRTNHELDRFVYSVSHDLRAPITSMKGLIEIAKDERDLRQLREYFGLMMSSLSKQDKFIKDIIDYSRNKRILLAHDSVNVATLIGEVVEQLQLVKDQEGIAIDTDVQPELIKTDSVRLKIILSNLISNALKYSDHEKSVKWVKINSRRQHENLVIEVHDNGIGIKEEDQPHIFDMFYVTSHTNKGTGLGLYIVKETINRLRGKIKVESKPGEGSHFIVTLPV